MSTSIDRTVDDILSKWYKTKTSRPVIVYEDSRPSCSAGEHTITDKDERTNQTASFKVPFQEWDDVTIRKANGESIAGAQLDERFRVIASRYGLGLEELGVVGPSFCKHMFIDPNLRDDEGKHIPFKIRMKYINAETQQKFEHTKGEIWKNTLFGKFLNSSEELGWCLNRDWTCEDVGEPFYLVMIQGEESVKQRLQRMQTKDLLEDIVKFVDEFSFDKEHMIKDADNSLRAYIDLILTSLKRYGNLAPEWPDRLARIEDHLIGNLQNLIGQGKEQYVNWIATDGKAENLIYVKNCKEILAWVDQGQRKELLEDWLKKLYPGKEKFNDEDYYRCFWGAPHVYLGQMNFSIQIGEHIPESVKDYFAGYIEKFVETGHWNGEKKKGWDKETAKLAANLINLGELSHVFPTYHTNRSPEWKRLADGLMDRILTDEVYARYHPTIEPIKNIQSPAA